MNRYDWLTKKSDEWWEPLYEFKAPEVKAGEVYTYLINFNTGPTTMGMD